MLSLSRHIFKILGKDKRKILGLTFIGFLSNIIELIGLASIIPFILYVAQPDSLKKTFLSHYLNRTLLSNDNNLLIVMLLGILVLFIFKAAITTFIAHQQAKFSYSKAADLSKRQMTYYLSQSYLFFKSRNSHKLVHEARNIPFNFGFGILLPYLSIISELLLVSVIIFIIGILNWSLLLILCVTLLPLMLIMYMSIRKRIKTLGEYQEKLQPVAYSSIHQVTQSFPIVKLSGKEKYFLDKFEGYQRKIFDYQTTITTLSGIPRRIIEIAAIVGIILITLYYVEVNPDLNLFLMLSLFATASYRLMPSLHKIFTSLMLIKKSEYTIEILERAPLFEEKSVSQEDSKLKFNKSIKLNNISFTYPDDSQPALKDICFDIKKGEVLGLAGKSGEGKSTLLYLIMQFIPPGKGEVIIDDKVLGAEDIKNWHKLIGFVKHHDFLLDGSIKENIILGNNRAEEKRLKAAIEDASLSNFIFNLQDKENTQAGEGGIKLSEGQKQRIGIARALYKDAEIFIFDEATSALDSKTEREVLESIKNLKARGKTVILVSHRISTLSICDRILLMEKGEITGTYSFEKFSKTFNKFNELIESDIQG